MCSGVMSDISTPVSHVFPCCTRDEKFAVPHTKPPLSVHYSSNHYNKNRFLPVVVFVCPRATHAWSFLAKSLAICA